MPRPIKGSWQLRLKGRHFGSCLGIFFSLFSHHISLPKNTKTHQSFLILLSCLSALCLFHMFFASFPSIACLLVSCLYLCMYTYRARTHGARAQSPKRKQKGRGCEHVDIRQAAMFSRFRGLASPIWLCTLLNPFPSSSFLS